jgi:hypothetical protein
LVSLLAIGAAFLLLGTLVNNLLLYTLGATAFLAGTFLVLRPAWRRPRRWGAAVGAGLVGVLAAGAVVLFGLWWFRWAGGSGDSLRPWQRYCEQADHIRLIGCGRSLRRRPIPVLLVSARSRRLEETVRVLVICRLHGFEPYSTWAVREWLKECARLSPAEAARRFSRVSLFIVPLANPDGAAWRVRGNAAGVDLNRDWQRRTQPEAQYLEAVFRRWQPHFVLDFHNFSRWLHVRWDAPFLEHYQGGQRAVVRTAADWHRQLLADLRARDLKIDDRYSPPGYSRNLTHRHFQYDHRAVSFLLEVGEWDPRPYQYLLDALIRRLNRDFAASQHRLDRLRGLQNWQAPPVVDKPWPRW